MAQEVTQGAYHLTKKSGWGVQQHIIVSCFSVNRTIATSFSVWIQKRREFVKHEFVSESLAKWYVPSIYKIKCYVGLCERTFVIVVKSAEKIEGALRDCFGDAINLFFQGLFRRCAENWVKCLLVWLLKSMQSQFLRIVVCYTTVFSVVTYSSQRKFFFCVNLLYETLARDHK